MITATLLCWVAFCVVLYSINPFETILLGFLLFYISLFLAAVGTLSLLGFTFRYIFNKNAFITSQVVVSFRQAVLFATLIVISLYLQSQNLITWWNLLILIILLIVIESSFIGIGNKMNSVSH